MYLTVRNYYLYCIIECYSEIKISTRRCPFSLTLLGESIQTHTFEKFIVRLLDYLGQRTQQISLSHLHGLCYCPISITIEDNIYLLHDLL
jgi:hypothetical protein